jgi:hypothetical protein
LGAVADWLGVHPSTMERLAAMVGVAVIETTDGHQMVSKPGAQALCAEPVPR